MNSPLAGEDVALHQAAEALGQLGQAVVGLDRTGRITSWNQRAASLSGWAPETAVGRPFYDLLVGRARLDLAEGLAALTDGRRWQAALDLEGPRGRPLKVEVSADPVEHGGTVQGAVGVLRSLSPAELDRRLHELSMALQTVPDAVLVVDEQARITEWNPAAEALFGWSRAEMLGAPVTQLVPVEEQPAFARVWATLADGGQPPPYETTRVDRDGQLQEVSVHAAGYRERGAFAGAVATFRQVTPRQHDDRVLAELVADLPVAVVAYDGAARVTLTAGGGTTLPGVAGLTEPGTDLLGSLPPGQMREAVAASLRGMTSQLQVPVDERIWQCHVAPADGGGGSVSAVDVTGERVLEDRLQALLSAAPLGFVAFDPTGRITYAAGSVFASFDVDAADMIGLPLRKVYGDDAELDAVLEQALAGQRLELVVERRGRVWDLHVRGYRDRSGAVTGGVCIVQDATARVDAEPHREPEPPAERDPLTGLVDRRGLERALDEPVRAGSSRAVAVLELEAFSLVGETYGVDTAGLVLQVVAGRLLRHCRPAVLGRWEDGAFVVVLDDPDAQDRLGPLLQAAIDAVGHPVVLPDGKLHLGASVGAASSQQVPRGELLEAAEQALQRARADGRGDVHWFTRQMRPVLAGARLVKQLQQAVTSDQLRLHYQPIVAIETREPVAVEALVRWEHPTEGLLAPMAFVPVAERTGLIHDLGRWVAGTACRQAVELAQAGTPLQVALNVSARQLVEHRLADMLDEVIDGTGCPPSALTVEVTETAVMSDLDAAVAALEQLKELGVGLALDDFGTGYSSLLYLRRFPVDTLKIDRSFVAGLGSSPEDTAIVASTISLGHSVGVRCVAEGVETLEQLELLRSMGCDHAQGYLFSRALPSDQLGPWLEEHLGSAPRRALWTAAPPPEADEILRMHAEGASLHTIAAALNLAGRRTGRGTRWRAQTVATVVANWAYPSLSRDDH